MTRVLIVEDEILISRDTEAMLVELGYQVTGIAATYSQTLSLVKTGAPDLILMDIKLKGQKDGIETAVAVQQLIDVPIIYVTAFTDKQQLERALNTTPFGYILKPFQANELYFAIEMALYKHKMEKKLKQSIEKYLKLFEQANDAVFIHSLKGAIYDVNGRACEMLGFKKNSLIKKSLFDLIAGTESRAVRHSLNETQKCGHARFETRFLKQDGTIIDVEISARIFDEEEHIVQGIVRDITDRKQAETNTRKLNRILEERVRKRTAEITLANQALKKLAAAVENSPVMVMITDVKGIIEYINPKFTELTGFALQELIGRNPEILNAGELPESVYTDLWRTIESGKEWTGDLCNRRQDGSIIWQHTSISPIFDETHHITHFVSISEDITEKRSIDEEIKSYINELEMFNKLMIDREMIVIELKEEVNSLLRELGRKQKFAEVWKKTSKK